jgi:hypothetical protein
LITGRAKALPFFISHKYIQFSKIKEKCIEHRLFTKRKHFQKSKVIVNKLKKIFEKT